MAETYAGNVSEILALQVKRAEDVFTVGKSNRVKEAMLGLEGRRKEREKTCSLKRGEAGRPRSREVFVLSSALAVSSRLWLPNTELPPYQHLVASCRNLSSCYCKKLPSDGPFHDMDLEA